MKRLPPLTEDQKLLVSQWYRLSMKMANQYRWTADGKCDPDEIHDRAVDGLISAARHFDPSREKSCPWFQFLMFILRQSLRHPTSKKQRIATEFSAKFENLVWRNGEQDLLDAQDRFQKHWHHLKPRDRVILHCLFDEGMKERELGRELMMSRSAIHRVKSLALDVLFRGMEVT